MPPECPKDCVTIYSECDYKGDYHRICEDDRDFTDEWEWPVRSVHIPEGHEVELWTNIDWTN